MAPRRRGCRTVAVLGLAVLALLLMAGVFAYRFVRDRYNPWLTDNNWEQVQPGKTLPQVEALLGRGRPVAMDEVKAAVEEQNAVGNLLLPRVAPGARDDWDDAEDVANQAVRQGVASWYRWQRGNTRLFVGVGPSDEVRLACLLRRPSGGDGGRTAWRFAVYPFGKGAVGPTGKSAEARLPEEKLVEQYVRRQAKGPGAVEIAAWGPHDLRGELRTVPGFQLTGPRARRPVAKLRVRYWAPGPDGQPQPNDRFFYVQDGEVFGSFANPYGDRWVEVLRDVERHIYGGR